MSKRMVFFVSLIGILLFTACQNINITDDTQAEIPTFDAIDGTYVSPKTISITTSTADAIIRYTVDGTAPNKTVGTLYEGPVVLTDPGIILLKAVAYTDTLLASSVAVATYTIVASNPNPLPSAPVLSSLSRELLKTTVTWTTVSGATSYTVYYKLGSTVTKTDKTQLYPDITGTTSFEVSPLVNGTEYAFIVTATNANGESVESNTITVKPGVPGTPTNLVATAKGPAEIEITWDAPSSGVALVNGYNIYRYPEGGTLPASPTYTGKNSPFSDVTGLSNPIKYFYSIKATSVAGVSCDSDFSTETSATTWAGTAPGAPGTPTVSSVSDGTVTLAWPEPTTGNPATSYKIYYKLGTTVSTSDPLNTTSASSPKAVTGLINTQEYAFIVTGINAYGEGVASGICLGTPVALPGTPTATATAHATLKQISINIAQGSGGTPTSYNLYRSTSSGSQGSTPLVTGLSAGIYTDTNSLAAGTYYYKVSAVNAAGEGALSTETSTTGIVPPTPTIAGNVASRGFVLEYTRYSFLANAITITSTNATGSVVMRDGDTPVFSGNGVFTNSTVHDASGAGFGASQAVSWSGYTYNGWGNSTGATASSTFPATTIGMIGSVTISAPMAEVLRISWDAVSGADRYAVYRRASTLDSWALLQTYSGAMSNVDFMVGPVRCYVCVTAYSDTNKYAGNKKVSSPSYVDVP